MIKRVRSKTFNPALIPLIAETVTILLDLFKNCRKPGDAVNSIENPNTTQLKILRRKLKNKFPDLEEDEYDDLIEACVNAGKSTTPEEQLQIVTTAYSFL